MKDFNRLLNNALTIIMTIHGDQKDKAGKPYILHPLRVMSKMTSEHEHLTALLHDVLEDSDLTINELAPFSFPNEVLTAVECITHRKNESYLEYIKRVKTNSLASSVKIEDLHDNMDLSRLSTITDKDIYRQRKYQKALDFLHSDDHYLNSMLEDDLDVYREE